MLRLFVVATCLLVGVPVFLLCLQYYFEYIAVVFDTVYWWRYRRRNARLCENKK